MMGRERKDLSEVVYSGWFAFADLVLVFIAGLLWYLGSGRLTWQPLLLALLPWALRLGTGRFPFRRTPFDVPLLLFLISAGIGVWAAYDRPVAWTKFWLLVGAVLLYYALAGQPSSNLWPIAGVLGFSGLLIGGYFLMTHDWLAFPAKFGPINYLLLGWAQLRPASNLPALLPNVAASLMAMSTPLLIAWGVHSWFSQRKHIAWIAFIAAAFLLVALLLTTSRGAWVGLAVATGLAMLVGLSRLLADRAGLSRGVALGLLLAATVVLATAAAALYPGGPVALLDRLPDPASATSRLELDLGTLNLIRDYPLTGGGLGSFPGLYSQYILVVPVFFLPNGHNIFLDAGLEQGPLGLAAMMIIFLGSFALLAAASKRPAVGAQDLLLLYTAIAASLAILLVHGLVEDTVYGSQAILFLYALPGLAVTASLPQDIGVTEPALRAGWLASVMVLVLAALLVAWFVRMPQSLASIWQSNLGAVNMARVELAGWPTNEWDDGNNVDALKPAETLFRKALSTGAANRTAYYHLGLIALLRRDFGQAVSYLKAADGLGGPHQGIRKTLAYSYVWAERFDEARMLMDEIPEAREEMATYVWWWGVHGRGDLADQAAKMAAEIDGTQTSFTGN